MQVNNLIIFKHYFFLNDKYIDILLSLIFLLSLKYSRARFFRFNFKIMYSMMYYRLTLDWLIIVIIISHYIFVNILNVFQIYLTFNKII